jgi:V8-like Glu-specific endopeptidase
MVTVPDDRLVFNTYLSHSYRSGDIDANDMFWSVFADQGFSFMVDARSDYFSLLYLETMMRRSHCFVAVVPRRDEHPNFSTYIKFEFDMARLARKPRFLVRCVDTNNDAFPMLQHDFQTEYATAFPSNSLPDLRRDVAEFRKQIEAQGARPITRSHLIGVLLEHNRRPRVFREIHNGLQEVAGKHNYKLEVLQTTDLDYGRLTALDRYDLLIIDASGRHVPPELFAFAHSRLIPSIKLVPLNDGEFPNDVHLPTISESLRSTPTDPLLYWRTPDELTITVDRELNELRRLDRTDPQQHATTVHEAKRYFRSLGRARLRVFLSNASEDQDLAVALSEALDDRYIDHFHYKDPRDLRSGVDWRLQLAREVSHECGVFVMLVSEHYWGSQWCTQEYQAARTRFAKNEMVILPFKIGPARDERLGSIQTPDLTQRRYSKYSTDDMAREIANLIADRLERDGDLRNILLQAEQIATLHAESIDIRPEAVIGGTDESLPAQWLVQGGFACRSIARLTVSGFRSGNPDNVKGQRRAWHGTGCLIADDILLTNFHVVAGSGNPPCSLEDFVSQAQRLTAQFGYISYRGQTRQFRVRELLSFDKALDYAAVRLEPIAVDRRPTVDEARVHEDDPMSTITWWGKLEWRPSSSLNEGERLNIIQHPAAGPMMVAFRRNTFERFSSGNSRIEYTTDTSEGSSGSPVFDDEWFMRALHSHARLLPEGTEPTLRPKANVGIPIEAIIKHIADERPDVMSKDIRRSPAQDG